MEYTELQLQSTPASRWELRGALSRTQELNNRKFATRASVENINGNLSGQVQSLKNECRSRLGNLESNQSNWVTNSSFNGLLNALKTVAFSGSYTDLTNTPIGFKSGGSALLIGGSGSYTGSNSISMGSGSSTGGSNCVALGEDVQASTGWSAAFGKGTTAGSAYTFAAGQNNTAQGSGSTVFGIGMTASGSASFACGQYGYNTTGLSIAFKIGVGSDNNNRYNLIEICDFNNGSDNGAMYISGIGGYDGTNAKASGGSTPGPDSLQKVITDVNTRLSDLETALSSSSSSPITASNGGYVLGSTSIAHAGSFAEGYQTYAYSGYSHAEGMNTSTANGMASHAEGSGTKSIGGANHAEGYITKSYGTASHSEGYKTVALNDYSHAGGNNTYAIAEAAHSEGIQTIAYGKASHAEGYGGNDLEYSDTNVIEVSEGPGGFCQLKTSTSVQAGDILMINWEINPNNTTLRLKVLEVLEETSSYTLVKVDAPISQISDIPADYESYIVLSSCKAAYGTYSHIEGYKTTASGNYSHAEGEGTETTNTAEHASGKYNQSTPSVTQFSVGIGADGENRANAFEVDVNGNVYIKGIGTYDGTNIGQNGVKSVQLVIADLTLQIAALTNN